MTKEDSEIIDFYPEEFHVDMNGKKMLWQGVALLPFIDEQRLLGAMSKKYPELTDDENRRNAFGKDVIFVNEDHTLYDQISSLYMKRKVDNVSTSVRLQVIHIDCFLSHNSLFLWTHKPARASLVPYFPMRDVFPIRPTSTLFPLFLYQTSKMTSLSLLTGGCRSSSHHTQALFSLAIVRLNEC